MDTYRNKNLIKNEKCVVCIPLNHLFGFCEYYKKILLNCNQILTLHWSSTDFDTLPVLRSLKIFRKIKKWRLLVIKVNDKEKSILLKVLDSQKTISCTFITCDLCEYPILPQNTCHLWTLKSSSMLEKPRFFYYQILDWSKK